MTTATLTTKIDQYNPKAKRIIVDAQLVSQIKLVTAGEYHKGDQAFKVKDGTATYVSRGITETMANWLGCPGANVVMIGEHGHTVGHLTPITGKSVKVPGWTSGRLGILSWFVPWGGLGEPLKGWVGR